MPADLATVPARGPMTPTMYRVVERRLELNDTVTLALAPTADPIESPAPGQFNMLWSFGIGEAPISLSGTEDELLWHTIRKVGSVTTALFDADVDDQCGIRGPYGTGWSVERAVGRDVVVVAGGLGLAPLRPVIAEVIARRDEFARVTVLIGARDPDGLLYRDQFDTWRGADITVETTVDAATAAWRGHVGLVTRLIDQSDLDADLTTAFVCGPEVMMRFCAESLRQRRVPATETFVSLERNMQCAVKLCGRCQLGSQFICQDGPVFDWATAAPLMRVRSR